MPRCQYACCKHGPSHRMGGCGFAHRLSDLSIPTGMNPRVWRDRSHERGGPAGIDWFVGQAYSPSQWERLLLYLGTESVASMPPWAKRLAWFMDLGDLDDYVCDGDFGWVAEALLYFNIEVTYGHGYVKHSFPFYPAEDRRSGMSLEDRMYRRMTTGMRPYGLYRARVSWQDAHLFSNDSKAGSGRYDRQFLDLEGGVEYVQILQSSGSAPWWYMVRVTALPKILSRGGWAPPTYFEATGDTLSLYEVPLDELVQVSNQSAEEDLAAPLPCDVGCIRVYVDGSADDRRGIAAGCVASGVGLSTRASLALPGMTGAEASELLGITLGLLVCYQSRRMHSRYVLLVDSANARDHVFLKQDPSKADGWHLWPAILLARNLVSLLGDLKIEVSSEKILSRRNLADHIARSEMQYRRERDWTSCEDYWPEPLPRAFQEVWRDVARNRRSSGMDTATGFFSKSYVFSDEVSSALDSIARCVV